MIPTIMLHAAASTCQGSDWLQAAHAQVNASKNAGDTACLSLDSAITYLHLPSRLALLAFSVCP
jgi:hypothetical protein